MNTLFAPQAIHGDYDALRDWYAAHGLLRELPPTARPKLTELQKAKRARNSMQRMFERRRAAGLTTRGTSPTLNLPREYQRADCCGYRYSRWRVRGAADWPDGHTHCCRCQNLLSWH